MNSIEYRTVLNFLLTRLAAARPDLRLCWALTAWIVLSLPFSAMSGEETTPEETSGGTPSLLVGWAEVDITPEERVLIRGQLHARLSEGVESPLKATALCLQEGDTAVAFVSCDLVSISDDLRQAVLRNLNRADLPLLLSATHTHTAPQITQSFDPGVTLPAMESGKYMEFAAEKIAEAVATAWEDRKPGSVAFGVDEAVIGRNRRWVDDKGMSTMYLRKSRKEEFRHIEGYEDHSLNLLATYDESGKLRGVVVNVGIPAQYNGQAFKVGADYWHEARIELRRRFGKDLFILPQISTAGDQSPHYLWGREAHERMLALRHRTWLEEIGVRIADAVGRILPVIESTRDGAPLLQHRHIRLDLPAVPVEEAAVEEAEAEAAKFRREYEERLAALPPEAEREARWYVPVTRAYLRSRFYGRVRQRFEQQDKTLPVEMDFVRLGEVVFVTMPFEVYLDYGIQIKVRSPFIQSFLVQLAGSGSYLSSPRGEAGKGYGSTPASSIFGAEAGQMMTEAILKELRELKPDVD